MPTHPRLERLVRLTVPEGTGSGYLVSARHILTAKHVVGDRSICDVELLNADGRQQANVIWTEDELDIALVELVEPVTLESATPVWASWHDIDLSCEALGYPSFQRLEGKERSDTERLRGHVLPDTWYEAGLLTIVPESSAWSGADWQGMSGAAVFVDGLLVGVVVMSHAERLLACPIVQCFEEPSLRLLLPDVELRSDALWSRADQPALRCIEAWRPPDAELQRLPSELLQAKRRFVPFDREVRAEAWRLLTEYCRGPARVDVLVLTGAGGAGKTRLLVEFCTSKRLERWLAGFVCPGVEDPRPLLEGDAPRLLVFDYAEADPRHVRTLLDAMMTQHSGPPVRVVLLARHLGSWFERLREESPAGGLLRRRRPYELAPLDPSDRRRLHTTAARKFGARSEAEQHDLDLADIAYERPLYIHMSALLDALGRTSTQLEREQPDEVVRQILSHERRFWRLRIEDELGRSPGSAMQDAEQIMTQASLVGGRRLDDGASDARRRVEFALHALYPDGDRIAPLTPDLLAEQLIYDTLLRDAERGPGLDPWLSLLASSDAPPSTARRALVMLGRISERGPSPARELLRRWLERDGRKLIERAVVGANDGSFELPGAVLAGALRNLDDPDLAWSLHEAIPKRTMELREAGLALMRVVVETSSGIGVTRQERASYAAALTNYGVRLREQGRLGDARVVIGDALSRYRSLAHERSDLLAYSGLAQALDNLSVVLIGVGEFVEARKRLTESLAVFENMLDHDRTRFLPGYANAQHNLSTVEHELGRHHEARSHAVCAVEARQELADSKPEEFRVDYAVSLGQLGAMLAAEGHWEQAAEITGKALEIIVELVERRPDAYAPELGPPLSNYAGMLLRLGRLEDARAASRRGITTLRHLADERPDIFRLHLASALDNSTMSLLLARRPEEIDRANQEEAHRNAIEAVDILRELDEECAGVHRLRLAGARTNLANTFSAMGDAERALHECQLAIEAFAAARDDATPEAYVAQLVRCHALRGTILEQAGRPKEARVALEDGLQIVASAGISPTRDLQLLVSGMVQHIKRLVEL